VDPLLGLVELLGIAEEHELGRGRRDGHGVREGVLAGLVDEEDVDRALHVVPRPEPRGAGDEVERRLSLLGAPIERPPGMAGGLDVPEPPVLARLLPAHLQADHVGGFFVFVGPAQLVEEEDSSGHPPAPMPPRTCSRGASSGGRLGGHRSSDDVPEEAILSETGTGTGASRHGGASAGAVG
jgi:hypothetical protein